MQLNSRWTISLRLLATLLPVLAILASCSRREPAAAPSALPAEPTTATVPQAVDDRIVTAPSLDESRFIAPLRDAYDRIDPAKDGWQSEAISEGATAQLGLLTALIENPARLNAESLNELVAPDFACGALQPEELELSLQQDGFTVRRDSHNKPGTTSGRHDGPAGFSTAIRAWLTDAVETGVAPHVKLKLYRIDPSPENTSSRVLCTVGFASAAQRTQINATWDCQWRVDPSGSQAPKLTSIEVADYEEVVAAADAVRFEDCTTSIVGGNPSWQAQLLRGTDHWRSRIPRDFGLDVVANHGLALGDINGDDLDDLYICQQGGLPNRMFRRNADGTVTDVTEESGTGWLDYCASALLVDLDNDGDRDLVVSQDFRILMMENDGTGKFVLAFGTSVQAQTFSMAAADYDVDGDLDLYVCGYNPSAAQLRSGAMGEPVPFHDANNGGRNSLWRNLGNWEFEDATAAVGLDQNNTRFSFAATWEDFDNDGDLDLYVANDYGRNNLYRHDGDRFVDAAAELEVEDTSAGMSVSWADCNRDGRMDLYISNMFSGAGNRITYQPRFKSNIRDDVRRQFQRMARGNTLFLGQSDGGFQDVSEEMAVTMGRWAWGSRFVDLNNDGWEDLAVVNGFITAPADSGDL